MLWWVEGEIQLPHWSSLKSEISKIWNKILMHVVTIERQVFLDALESRIQNQGFPKSSLDVWTTMHACGGGDWGWVCVT